MWKPASPVWQWSLSSMSLCDSRSKLLMSALVSGVLLVAGAAEARCANAQLYTLAAGDCQTHHAKGDGFAVRAMRGTLYAVDGEHTLRLERGRILLASSRAIARLEAGSARLQVQPDSAVLVETGPGGVTRVYCLDSSDPLRPGVTVTCDARFDTVSQVMLTVGQELVTALRDVTAEDALAADGIERRPVAARPTYPRMSACTSTRWLRWPTTTIS